MATDGNQMNTDGVQRGCRVILSEAKDLWRSNG